MEEFFEIIKLIVGITVMLGFIKAYNNRKRGRIEKLSKAGKVSLIINTVLVAIYVLARSGSSQSFDLKILKYLSEGFQLFALFYSFVFYLNHFGILKDWLIIEKDLNNNT